jgi:hypothetical protein
MISKFTVGLAVAGALGIGAPPLVALMQGHAPSYWPDLIDLAKYVFYVVATLVAAGVAWVARFIKQMVETWLANQRSAPDRFTETVKDAGGKIDGLKAEMASLRQELVQLGPTLREHVTARLTATDERVVAIERRIVAVIEQHRAEDLDGLRAAVQSLRLGPAEAPAAQPEPKGEPMEDSTGPLTLQGHELAHPGQRGKAMSIDS